MTVTVMNDYLVFPVYTHSANKKLVFQYEGEVVYQLNLKLDHASPDFYAYIDVSRFKGKDLELTVTPEMDFSFRETDTVDIDHLYREAYRPQVHFTVKNGFLGKPKKFVYENGCYHLFYAYNPADVKEGDSHLGYATSKDLIHWQEESMRTACECAKTSDEACEHHDLFSLKDSEGNQKWISMDETGVYRIGTVENGQFQSEQPEQRLHYGRAVRYGKNLSDVTSGKMVRVDRGEWEASCRGFCGQMGMPTELSLKKEDGNYYLQATPVEELSILYKNTNRYENIKTNKTVTIPLADAAQFIRMKGNFDENTVLRMTLFGRELQIDFSENQIRIGNSKAPVSLIKKDLDVALLIDRCGMEIFADGGKICLFASSEDAMMDRNLLRFSLASDTEYSLDLLEIHSLAPIWQTSPKKF